MTDATALARTVVEALIAGGVTEVVIAPGSRNAPLSFAGFDAAAAGLLRLHTRIDERTAAFLALGMAKVSGRPAAVICTSGTAVANFHPAALEAAHSGVPLVPVTADRPASLRGTTANQTTNRGADHSGPRLPRHRRAEPARGDRQPPGRLVHARPPQRAARRATRPRRLVAGPRDHDLDVAAPAS
ncbi:thiamine pyrophosphate-binding protein [Nocardioides sp. B-3]|uniref:thiamine pyrophosphate-binding protein n=1 Tax=Nocardioides sp. B-3 TaxID=2895565 RepID=UPI002152706F|nr:thiamine pyrophosphate-binding protein [Nocardioides sp. B-3]UUZ60751.1 hypothetical protein LP418_08250 [Nocardioides sp. B-3]